MTENTDVVRVPTIRFGRTGVQVPRISLGTWAYGGENKAGETDVGWSGHDDEDARGALRSAYRHGITHWDTADVYGNGQSESLIGAMWDEIPRADIFLASKVGYYPGDFDHYYHPTLVRQQLERSLSRLRTDVIDLYYLHHCDFGPDDVHLDGALSVIREYQAAGHIRFIGLSDWSNERIMACIDKVDPDAVQPLRSVTHDHFQASGLAAYAADNDLGVAFFSPIRHGLLLGKYDSPTTFAEGDFRNNDKGFSDQALLDALIVSKKQLQDRFADRAEPVLGALLGALTADAPSGCVLLGQRSVRQVVAAANAALAQLDEAEAAWVRGLYRELG